jgi:hypothetical protein
VNWINGWVFTVQSAGYRPGFYGSLSKPSFATAYNSAYNTAQFQHVFLWANQPSNNTRQNLGQTDQPTTYAPDVPAGRDGSAALWQYLLSDTDSPIDVDADIATEAGFTAMW